MSDAQTYLCVLTNNVAQRLLDVLRKSGHLSFYPMHTGNVATVAHKQVYISTLDTWRYEDR